MKSKPLIGLSFLMYVFKSISLLYQPYTFEITFFFFFFLFMVIYKNWSCIHCFHRVHIKICWGKKKRTRKHAYPFKIFKMIATGQLILLLLCSSAGCKKIVCQKLQHSDVCSPHPRCRAHGTHGPLTPLPPCSCLHLFWGGKLLASCHQLSSCRLLTSPYKELIVFW